MCRMIRLYRAALAAAVLILNASAAGAAPAVPDATALMDWAERTYPHLFPGHQPNQTLAPYVFRHYPGTGNYVGVSGSAVYVLGPVAGSNTTPLYVGELAAFACQVTPGNCGSMPSGANDCDDLTFTKASRYEARRRHTSPAFDVVESRDPVQSAVYRGRDVLSWRLVHESTGPAAGDRSTTEDTHYFERTGERAIAFHGQIQESVSVIGGRTSVSRTEYQWDPPWMDYTSALSPGDSYTETVTSLTTQTLNGVTSGPTSDTARFGHRFIGYETLRTAAGSFPACRFEQTDPDGGTAVSTVWVWRGYGIELERENRITIASGAAFTTRILLQSLTVNGQRVP